MPRSYIFIVEFRPLSSIVLNTRFSVPRKVNSVLSKLCAASVYSHKVKCVSLAPLQAAEACQQKLETQVSIFLSMLKNEENNSKRSPIHVLTAPSQLLPVSLIYCLSVNGRV